MRLSLAEKLRVERKNQASRKTLVGVKKEKISEKKE